MRRYVVNLWTLLCINLLHSETDTCSEINELGNLDCYTNYADCISCTWYKGSYPGNGPFLLTLIDSYGYEMNRTFNLVSSPYSKSFTCDITYKDPSDLDKFKIIVEDSSSAKNVSSIDMFKPHCNVKLDPPSDLSYNFTGTTYKIMWEGNSGFSGAPPIHYEVKIKKEASGQETIKNDIHDRNVELLLSEFDEGSNYIQIHCRTNKHYKSQWSEWSSALKIEKFEKGQKQDIIRIITIVTLLTMTLILLFLALCSSLSSRINVSFVKKIPTAADFFHPLYHIHNGNFQDWIKYPNKCEENKEDGRPVFNQDIDLYSTTVLYVQKEPVSSVKLEPPLPDEDIPLPCDTCNSMSWSDPLVEREISLTGIYPTFFTGFPSFSDDIMDENDTLCSLDCPTDYFSYNGNYIANSQEIAE